MDIRNWDAVCNIPPWNRGGFEVIGIKTNDLYSLPNLISGLDGIGPMCRHFNLRFY